MNTRTMREICPSFEKKHRLKSLEKTAEKATAESDQKKHPGATSGMLLLNGSHHQFPIEAFNLNEFCRGKARIGEPVA